MARPRSVATRVDPPTAGLTSLTTRWGGLQRRVRRLAPPPLRRADLAVFRTLAGTEIPVLGPALPRLTRAANHSRLWMAIAGVLAATGGRFGRRAAVRGLLAIGVSSAVSNLPAKLVTGRTRPDLSVVPEVRRLARVPTSTSFPSGHSASAFAFATAASLEQPRLRVPLFALATAVATSRVYTGVHYPGDVLVGSAIGVAVGRATTRTWPLATHEPATAQPADDHGPLPDTDGTGLVIVTNVEAGSSLTAAPAERLQRALPGARTVTATPDDDLVETMRGAVAGARALAAVGGNGTASAAAAVAREAGIPLLVVPGGTFNHLAKDLGIATVDDCVRAVRDGRTIAIDVGEIGGTTFLNGVSLGAYQDFVRRRERLEPEVGKWPATLWSTLRVLFRGEPLELEVDGRRRRVWLLVVGNGCYRAEGIAPTRRVRLDDGLLDVRLVHAERRWARTRIVLSMLGGRLRRCAAYEHWTAAELGVRSPSGSLRIVHDGEVSRLPDGASVHKLRRALLVLQPEPHRPAG